VWVGWFVCGERGTALLAKSSWQPKAASPLLSCPALDCTVFIAHAHRAIDMPRFADEVVFPTPPFPEVMTMTRFSPPSTSCSASDSLNATGRGPRRGLDAASDDVARAVAMRSDDSACRATGVAAAETWRSKMHTAPGQLLLLL
jgi:hypothetical protein